MDTKEISKAPCNRHSDLVTYLYDEGSEVERRSFDHHLEECAVCRGELSAFSHVRQALGAWNLGLNPESPRMEIAVKRNSIETLRDILGIFSTWPAWLRLTGAAAVAVLALIFVLAVAGTRVNVREGTISFGLGWGRDRAAQSETARGEREGTERGGTEAARLTRAEIEILISERVATISAENRKQDEDLRARVVSLSSQLANAGQSQSRLAATLAALRTEQRALAAKGQSTLGEWLFAANGAREPWGGDDEKDN